VRERERKRRMKPEFEEVRKKRGQYSMQNGKYDGKTDGSIGWYTDNRMARHRQGGRMARQTAGWTAG
jgi:hypothetical protein